MPFLHTRIIHFEKISQPKGNDGMGGSQKTSSICKELQTKLGLVVNQELGTLHKTNENYDCLGRQCM